LLVYTQLTDGMRIYRKGVLMTRAAL